MFFKSLPAVVFAAAMAISTAAAEVRILVGPPHVVVQKRGRAPARGHVWVQGYHNHDGNGYVWVPGTWQQPPRPRQRWVRPRWVHQRNGWVMVQGRWR